jgi:prepilin-type N-terminal cleavage/methylation domain-containing protein
MNKKNKKGFTIIELIVVIAIIAVLAAIVLVNVTQYINKGKNAAIKGDLSSVTVRAAVYFDSTSAGTGSLFIASSDVTSVTTALAASNIGVTAVTGASTLASTIQQWCMCAPLIPTSGTTTFCVDGLGAKVEYATGACSTHCSTGAAATDGVCK